MEENNVIDIYEKTAEWLENEAARYVRLFQLARTKKEKEAYKKKIGELLGRLRAELRTLKCIMDSEI